jgi:hypothetical protein
MIGLNPEHLRRGKYTKWALKIETSDQLEALLWLLGEHYIRFIEGDPLSMQHPRCRAAHTALMDFHRRPFGLEEAKQRMRDALNRGPSLNELRQEWARYCYENETNDMPFFEEWLEWRGRQ